MPMIFVMSVIMIMVLTVAMLLVLVLVMWHVLVVVPIVPDEVDRPATGIVRRAVLTPVLLVARRYVQVDRSD